MNKQEDPQIKIPRLRPIALIIGTTVIFPVGDMKGEVRSMDIVAQAFHFTLTNSNEGQKYQVTVSSKKLPVQFLGHTVSSKLAITGNGQRHTFKMDWSRWTLQIFRFLSASAQSSARYLKETRSHLSTLRIIRVTCRLGNLFLKKTIPVAQITPPSIAKG